MNRLLESAVLLLVASVIGGVWGFNYVTHHPIGFFGDSTYTVASYSYVLGIIGFFIGIGLLIGGVVQQVNALGSAHQRRRGARVRLPVVQQVNALGSAHSPSPLFREPSDNTISRRDNSSDIAIMSSVSFDVAKWNALLNYDLEIGQVAAKLRPFGERWVNEFAASYLALNDKSYLPSIVSKIIQQAREEEEKQKRLKAERVLEAFQREKEEQEFQWAVKEKLRLEAEQRAETIRVKEERRTEKVRARKERFGRLRHRLWGTWPRRLANLSIVLLIVSISYGSYWYYQNYVRYPALSYDGTTPLTFQFRGMSMNIDTQNTVPGVTARRGNDVSFTMRVGTGWSGGYHPDANIFAVRLDASVEAPQLVLTYFTGGAHCCTETGIATADATGKWHIIDAGQVDGDGFQFTDLTGDGASELVGNDDSFLYAFDCYACSYVPTRILRLSGTALRDVTQEPQYSTYVRHELERGEQSVAQAARSNPQLVHSNGYLSAWVAQKALLGEVEDAWLKMLASYDRNSKFPLEECLVADLEVYKCPPNQKRRMSFPEALAKHLIAHGYPMPKEVRFQ